MSWNNKPNLPFSADGPERGPFNLTLNNPPFVPAQYNGPQPIANILGLICAAAAIEIQQNANKNPLRTFMYNQYSRSEPANAPPFNNPEFAMLIEAICEYIVLEMNSNRYADVEKAAQNCVPQMCEMLCAINLRVFPDLEAYVNQNVVQTLRNTIAKFDETAQRIKNMRSGNNGWNNNSNSGNNGWGGGNNWGNSNQGGWGNNQGGGSQNRWNNSGGNSWNTTGAKPSTGGNTSLFNSDDRRSSTNSGSGVGGKWASESPLKQPYEQRQVKAKEPEVIHQEEQQNQPIEASLASGLIKWQPSNRFPYIPASAPTVGEIWLRKHPPTREYPNGLVEPFLKEKDSNMDFDKHATGHVFGPVPRSLDISSAAATMSKIDQGVRKINNTVAMTETEKAAPEVTTLVNQAVMLETSLESAWLAGALKRLTSPTGELPDVYRAYAKIAQPIITGVDMTDVIKNFGQSKTYIELREKLQASIDEKTIPALWGEINHKLTVLVNRILQQKLALTGSDGQAITIDSYIADIEDLIQFLGKEFGQNVQQAFLKNQKDEIHSVFLTLDEKNASVVTDNYLADMIFSEGNKPVITYVASDYSLTYLNCLSYELDIDLAKGLGTLITEAVTPVANAMLSGLFDDINERGNSFERHLITTNDGRILEAARGYLGDKNFLLTLVK